MTIIVKKKIAIIGGGLAGVEVANLLSKQGHRISIFEMRPKKFTPAHKSDKLAELVCSNSLRSKELTSAVGLLKHEMTKLNSLIMEAAYKTEVPAGKSLAVDREHFADYITNKLESFTNVEIVREEITSIKDPNLTGFDVVVISAGPLISEPLAKDLLGKIGGKQLYFYDAIAPIVSAESINWDKVFWGSRYDEESTDYVNCPMTEEEYYKFREELIKGEKVKLKSFEKEIHFEGCLPIEVMAERGELTLAYGPLKPVGLIDPRTGKRPFAVVQLRAENREKTMFNMVGFQTKLTYKEQKRIFRMIPGLENAEFLRLGSIHRNTYVNSPKILTPYLEVKELKDVYLAGQITGVEGYVESAACGLVLGIILSKKLAGEDINLPPEETAIGGLMAHLRRNVKDFQPMNVNFGLIKPINVRAKKSKKRELIVQRALEAFDRWLETI
ncbi:methylenetetrahydrofolate--tRNA-(uracil(54)-C(5)) -methyltransferase (FADH(2)-oxidizing) TrmFO [Desulfothermus naphthae]